MWVEVVAVVFGAAQAINLRKGAVFTSSSLCMTVTPPFTNQKMGDLLTWSSEGKSANAAKGFLHSTAWKCHILGSLWDGDSRSAFLPFYWGSNSPIVALSLITGTLGSYRHFSVKDPIHHKMPAAKDPRSLRVTLSSMISTQPRIAPGVWEVF